MGNLKKPFIDASLSIIGTAVPLTILQLVILPSMAGGLDVETYAIVVTMLSVFNLFPGTLGNALNNIRLIYSERYYRSRSVGDFQYLFALCLFTSSLLVAVLAIAYGVSDIIELFLLILISCTWAAREYLCVEFRLNLNFKGMLISNLWLSAGYALGSLLFLYFRRWEYVYLVGQLISLGYIICKSKIWHDPFCMTESFRAVGREFGELTLSNMLTRALSYSDRLIVYPILGSSAVTQYYVASLAGKLLSTAIGPINSVVLSYLAKAKRKPVKSFIMALFAGILACVITYIVIIVCADPILSILYPSLVQDALSYVWIASLSSLVYTLISMVQPFTLRYYSMKWQLISNAISLFVYVILSVVLSFLFGLMGFCIASLIVNLLKLMFQIVLYLLVGEDSMSV